MNTWTILKSHLAPISAVDMLIINGELPRMLKTSNYWRDVNQAADLYCQIRTRLTHHQRKIADEEFEADQDVRDAALQRDNLEKIKQP